MMVGQYDIDLKKYLYILALFCLCYISSQGIHVLSLLIGFKVAPLLLWQSYYLFLFCNLISYILLTFGSFTNTEMVMIIHGYHGC